MVIRRALQGDISLLHAFDGASRADRKPVNDLPRWQDYVLNHSVYAAFADDTAIAYLCLINGRDDRALIGDFFVGEAHRRQGLGRRLLETALRVIDADRLTPFIYVYRDNDTALALYRAYGFTDHDEQEFARLNILTLTRAPHTPSPAPA